MYNIKLDKEDYLRYQLFTASKSKRIRSKRIRTWISLTVCFLVLGLIMNLNSDSYLSYYFIIVSILTLIFYPLYQRRQYKRNYEKHIEDNYGNKIGIEIGLGFENGFIISKGANQEGKIKLTEIQEINEISDNLFIKIKTGESVIISSKFSEYNSLRKQLYELMKPLDISWNEQLDWKWQ